MKTTDLATDVATALGESLTEPITAVLSEHDGVHSADVELASYVAEDGSVQCEIKITLKDPPASELS